MKLTDACNGILSALDGDRLFDDVAHGGEPIHRRDGLVRLHSVEQVVEWRLAVLQCAPILIGQKALFWIALSSIDNGGAFQ